MTTPGLDEIAHELSRILRGRSRHKIYPDGDGWVRLDDAAFAVAQAMQHEVEPSHIYALGRRHRNFELITTHIRLSFGRPSLRVPDILFGIQATESLKHAFTTGTVSGHNGILHLHTQEHLAWLESHRETQPSQAIVVDALHARRTGVRFLGSKRPGCFTATPLPIRHVLNLRPNYAEQHSAGGLPVRMTTDRRIEVALVEVSRRGNRTWEVAKGKLEIGEAPQDAAVREIQEETGLSGDFEVLRHITDIRYAFVAPGSLTRLKTIYLYIIAFHGDPMITKPALAEGIGNVRWFSPEDAARAVSHTSLIPAMARARDLLAKYGLKAAPHLNPSMEMT